MREDWKKIIEEEMMRDAESIMEEINSDPELKDLVAPEEIHDRLFAQIHEYEQQRLYEQLSDEDKELIRLGKVYKKRRKLSKFLIVAAAALVVLGIGTVCIGEDKNILSVLSSMFAGGERTTVDSGDTELVVCENEIETYEKIEKEYNFRPVKLRYLPENTAFYKAEFSADMQGVNIIYKTENGTSIIYIIRPNYREASLGTIIEDEKKREYTIIVNNIEVSLTEYNVVETGTNRWNILFTYQEVQYLLRINDMKQEEVEKIVNNLRF